jgi:hypothetical protein
MQHGCNSTFGASYWQRVKSLSTLQQLKAFRPLKAEHLVRHTFRYTMLCLGDQFRGG